MLADDSQAADVFAAAITHAPPTATPQPNGGRAEHLSDHESAVLRRRFSPLFRHARTRPDRFARHTGNTTAHSPVAPVAAGIPGYRVGRQSEETGAL
jgi:hypothetical protein